MVLPLEGIPRVNRYLRQRVPGFFKEHPTKIPFACSNIVYQKCFLVDVADGSVWNWAVVQGRMLRFERAVPGLGFAEHAKVELHSLSAKPELNGKRGVLVKFDEGKGRWQVRMDDDSSMNLLKQDNLKLAPTKEASESFWPEDPTDGLIRWFEEYADRLDKGYYTKRQLKPEIPESQGISLFPTLEPEMTRCVTRHVEVTASCIYMPEHPQGWTYSIAFKLLGTQAERGFKTCQLTVRHWEIQEVGQEVQHVDGEGVIGFFPILTDGGWICNRESDPHEPV